MKTTSKNKGNGIYADVSGNKLPFKSQSINDFFGIDISQPTPSEPPVSVPLFSLDGTYFYTVRLVMQDNQLYCAFSWAPKFDKQRTQESYFIFISVFLIFLPLCVILTLYALILIELHKRKLNENGASPIRCQREKEDATIAKRIRIIVFLFLFCISPITVSA